MSDDLEGARGALSARLASRLSGSAAEWFEAALRDAAGERGALVRRFAAAGRKLGHGPLVDRASHGRLFGDRGPLLDPWRLDEAGRAALVLEHARKGADTALEAARSLYAHGSGAERIAVLRALQFFPESDGGLPCLRDALRTNAVNLFAAAICENLYASRRLADPAFFQAVLKCVFVGLSVRRVEGVEERCTADLSRMLYAYATEREHAARPVAAELWPLIALHPPEGAAERIAARLAAATGEEERRLLAMALARVER